MPTVKKSIEVNVPVRIAYDQWTQFEVFPRFMEGVEAVQQLDDKRLHWRAKIAGKVEEWDADIVEQVPDRVISWRSTSGARNQGTVRFAPLGDNKTRIELEMHWEPKDVTERVGDVLGADDLRIQGDLERFKKFIEELRTPTGGWRGEIHGDRVEGERAEEDQEAGTGHRPRS
ncbi:MAG: SRPBCC family protein [Chloroflexi bacterium]|nr:MAG: SRPBCC family protein [Chloroflexota bacterium]